MFLAVIGSSQISGKISIACFFGLGELFNRENEEEE